MGRPLKDLTGKRFGKLVITRRTGVYGKRNVLWLCRCDCGKEREFLGCNLYNGTTTSCGCQRALGLSESAYNSLLRGYKYSASRKGSVFELSRQEFMVLVQSNCFYCGTEPKQVHKAHRGTFYKDATGVYGTTLLYNGIDRRDNSLGYTSSNCVPCCKTCNHAKLDSSLEDFESWISRLIAFRSPQK